MRPTRLVRFLGVVAALVVSFALCLLVWLPSHRNWGATNEEIARALPGDDLVPNAGSSETRALTIAAPVERVWPWLTQLGQDRGGFYSYTILENLVGCRMPDVDVLDARLQTWRAGDQLWMYPREKMNGVGGAEMVLHEPGRALVFATHPFGMERRIGDASWGFVVEPIDAQTTRLLVRGRAVAQPRFFWRAFDLLFFQPAHFVMERKMMTTVKSYAEGGRRTPMGNDVEVACWTALFVMFVTSGAFALGKRSFARSMVAMLAAAFAFQTLTFVQPGPWIALLVTLVVGVIVPWRRGERRRGRAQAGAVSDAFDRSAPAARHA